MELSSIIHFGLSGVLGLIAYLLSRELTKNDKHIQDVKDQAKEDQAKNDARYRELEQKYDSKIDKVEEKVNHQAVSMATVITKLDNSIELQKDIKTLLEKKVPQ